MEEPVENPIMAFSETKKNKLIIIKEISHKYVNLMCVVV